MINNSDKLFIQADKTSNMYKMDPDQYNKLLNQNITSNYKKADPNTATQINRQGQALTPELKMDNIVEMPANKECYIAIKDHKPGFPQRHQMQTDKSMLVKYRQNHQANSGQNKPPY